MIPTQVGLVEQNPQELGNGQRRVRIVELDGDFLGKCVPIVMGAPETPQEIGDRRGHEEILLHEAQSLAEACRVIGIQDAR